MFNENYITEARETLGKELSIQSCSGEQWMEMLALRINELIANDFSRLIEILYRMDVDESKIRKVLKEHPLEDPGRIIGELIVERQVEKIKSRQNFSSNDSQIDEDEKW